VPCYDPQQVKDFSDAHRGQDRRMRLETSKALVKVNRGLEALDAPGTIADIRAAVHAEGKLGYEQLEARATWVDPARRALREHLIRRHEGRVALALHYGYDHDQRRYVLRLVDVMRPHITVDCAAVAAAETVQDALARLVGPLSDAAYAQVDFAIVETQRLVSPAAHPLRKASPNVEYALRADPGDAAPLPQSDIARQRRDRSSQTMAQVTATAGTDFVPTYSLSGTGLHEIVAALGDGEDSHLLLKPAISGDTILTGAERSSRAGALREMAVAAAAHEEYAGDQRPLTHFIARQEPRALEHLYILRGLLGAAATWSRR
jgi:hypothetical protein